MRKFEFESPHDADEFTGILHKQGILWVGEKDADGIYVLVSDKDYPRADELYEEFLEGVFDEIDYDGLEYER